MSPIDPAYYIEDCWILNIYTQFEKRYMYVENMVQCSVWDMYSHTFEESAAFYGLKEVNYLVQSQTYTV